MTRIHSQNMSLNIVMVKTTLVLMNEGPLTKTYSPLFHVPQSRVPSRPNRLHLQLCFHERQYWGELIQNNVYNKIKHRQVQSGLLVMSHIQHAIDLLGTLPYHPFESPCHPFESIHGFHLLLRIQHHIILKNPTPRVVTLTRHEGILVMEHL